MSAPRHLSEKRKMHKMRDSGKSSNWAWWRLVDVGGHDVVDVVVVVCVGLRNGQIVC